MKLRFWIVYWLMKWIVTCGSQQTETHKIDCTNNEPVTSIFNEPIDLTLRGIIKVYENVTINEILATRNTEFKLNYIDARLESNNVNGTKDLILFATEHFENYAKEQRAVRISLKINLGCGMARERVVHLKEGNYFDPTFSKDIYELFVPTPIFVGFDLTAFVQITATDNDLIHNQITFESNDSLQYFVSVGTKNVTSADKKTYFANLTLVKVLLELPQPIEFEIVATDNGEPPKRSKASIKISSDPARSLPPKPKFTQAIYKSIIDLNFSMEPIQLRLENGTYTSEVKFVLNGFDREGFHLKDNRNGTVDILWNPTNLNRTLILQHKTWELEVKAEHGHLADVAVANILVRREDFEDHFHFMSTYYEGRIDEIGKLHIQPITFNSYLNRSDIEFSLQSSHDFFYFSIRNFSIQLHLNNNFTWQVIDDVGYLKLSLQASWEHLSAMTNIVIKLPQMEEEASKKMLKFEKPLYVGQLNKVYDLELERIILRTDVLNAPEIEYNLKGNDSELFYVLKKENESHIEIKMLLNAASKPEIKLKNSYLLILEAKNVRKDIEAFATILINVFGQEEKKRGNVFLTPLVKGNIYIDNGTQQLSVAAIHVAKDLRAQFYQLQFRLEGDHSLHFDVEINFSSHTLGIVLKTPLSSNILATRQLLNMTVEATANGPDIGPDILNDRLWIFIELPPKDCSTSANLQADSIQFSSSIYLFTIYTNQGGILGEVSAFSTGNNATLHYTLDVENDLLAERLSINSLTGELILYGLMEEGSYAFNVIAENVETRERTAAKALLKVQRKEECRLLEGVTTVEKTLIILHVDEEKSNHGLLDMKFNENCTFHIVDMWPNDKEYVHVNYIFNMLDAIPIDREDKVFQNMPEPQILVKLRLTCDRDDKQQNLTIDVSKSVEKRSTQITFYEDMPYSHDIMWLYIKIDDINDNPPEFKISDGPIYLGYPSGNSALDIYPEYLTQIEAFDRDLGFNAQIKFTLRDNPYFDIEPRTGKIYPKAKALSKDEQTELIVLATDQYGEGLISRTLVVVKGLSSDFYSLVTLNGNSGKTKQEVEAELSKGTGYNIKVLKMSYVPKMERQRSTENQNLTCKAWIYGYVKHQLVTHKEIQKKVLVNSPEASIMNVESYSEAALCSPIDGKSKNLSYLIVTILLSLISCSSLIFIIWRFCYKPALATTKCHTNNSTLGANHDVNAQQQIFAECSHGSGNFRACAKCNNHENHHVKFNDLVENGMVDELQSK